MNAKSLMALVLLAAGTSAAHAGHSVAACKEYAQNAVNQVHTLDAAGCQGAPGDSLWSGNYDQHYQWCISANGDLGHEFKRRRLAIEACQRHSDAECRKYADNAVNQTREAVRNSCPHIGPPVWSENFQGHYDWCKNNPNADLGHEFKTRRVALESCKAQGNSHPGISASTQFLPNGQAVLHVSGSGFARDSRVKVAYRWTQTSPRGTTSGASSFDVAAQGDRISGEVAVSCPAGYRTSFTQITATDPTGKVATAVGGAGC